MLTAEEYIRQSLVTNLFFLRLMKEHLIFASAALTLRDSGMVQPLMGLKEQFEGMLTNTIYLANGALKPQSLAWGDMVTSYTYNAELMTQYYTGLPINTEITRLEISLVNGNAAGGYNPMLAQQVNTLNQNIITLLSTAINTQKNTIVNILSCRMFTNMYPLMLEHVTREAEHYMQHLETLQSQQSLVGGPKASAEGEVFWNRIMGEHSKFIRGMLDPSEDALIQKANGFAGRFDELVQAAIKAYDQLSQVPAVTRNSKAATTELRNFKEQGTQGILECKIRSVILPLLSDHVLREANHYLRELNEFKV